MPTIVDLAIAEQRANQDLEAAKRAVDEAEAKLHMAKLRLHAAVTKEIERRQDAKE